MKTLRIDVWSDIACPWCYVGKRRLEAALARFPERDAVEVRWRAFELDPSAKAEVTPARPYAERLARKYGSTVKEAERMIERMTRIAAEDGLDFRFDRLRPANMFAAHRVLHLAHERGKQDAVKERFLHAYMTDGESMAEHATLARLAAEAGLEADEVSATLASDAYAYEVREDERQAAELGISAVPFFVIGDTYGVSGAQPADVLLSAITTAWAEIADRPARFAEGEACGPDGCAIPSSIDAPP